MKCLACHHRNGFLSSVILIISLLHKQYRQCPHCGINIYRQVNPTWEYFKLISFVVGWFGVLLFLLAVIFGRHVGYESALRICFGFWIMIILVFMLIVLGNLGLVFLQRIMRR